MSHRFLANENFPLMAVQALRRAGHDLAWILTEAPGSPDEMVLARSRAEGRLLLTFDKDFGALVFKRGASASAGVVLFRIVGAGPEELADRIVRVLGARTDWEGHFSVVEPDRVNAPAARVELRRP